MRGHSLLCRRVCELALISCRALRPHVFQALKATAAVGLAIMLLGTHPQKISGIYTDMHGQEHYNIIISMYRKLETTYMFKNYSTISIS